MLHQGWLLTPANLESFLSTVISGIQRLEEHVSRIAACVIDELGEFRSNISMAFGLNNNIMGLRTPYLHLCGLLVIVLSN